MLTPHDIPKIEAGLTAAGISIDDFCREAGIDRSTWTRWRSFVVTPGLGKWLDAVAAFQSLTGTAEVRA